MKLKGIILAGGKSSRFGGDKALARWEGTTLLGRVVKLLTDLGLDPEVIAKPGKNYDFLTRPAHNDLIPEKGPLGGLHTAFSIFPGSTFLVLTCDMPFLTQNILKELIEAHRVSGGRSVIFEVGGMRQPFPGIYAAALAGTAQECLASDQRSLKHLLSRIPDLQVLPEPTDIEGFVNVNTRQDLSDRHARE